MSTDHSSTITETYRRSLYSSTDVEATKAKKAPPLYSSGQIGLATFLTSLVWSPIAGWFLLTSNLFIRGQKGWVVAAIVGGQMATFFLNFLIGLLLVDVPFGRLILSAGLAAIMMKLADLIEEDDVQPQPAPSYMMSGWFFLVFLGICLLGIVLIGLNCLSWSR